MVRSTAYALLGLPATLLLSGGAHAWEHLDQETFLATSQAHQVAVVACESSFVPERLEVSPGGENVLS